MPRNPSSHSTSPAGAFRDIFVNISSPSNLTILCKTAYLFHSNHDWDFVSKFNQSMGSIIPILLVLLQLKYLSSDPFDTHPYTVGVAVFSLFTYYLARALHERCSSSSLPRLSALSFHCMVWFGDISVASLMSLFLPGWIQPILYIVFGLISGAQFLQKLFVGGTGSGPFSAQGIRHFLRNFCSSERDYDLPRYSLQS